MGEGDILRFIVVLLNTSILISVIMRIITTLIDTLLYIISNNI